VENPGGAAEGGYGEVGNVDPVQTGRGDGKENRYRDGDRVVWGGLRPREREGGGD